MKWIYLFQNSHRKIIVSAVVPESKKDLIDVRQQTVHVLVFTQTGTSEYFPYSRLPRSAVKIQITVKKMTLQFGT